MEAKDILSLIEKEFLNEIRRSNYSNAVDFLDEVIELANKLKGDKYGIKY